MTISVRVTVEDSRGPNVEVEVYQVSIRKPGEIGFFDPKLVAKLMGGSSHMAYVCSDTELRVKETKNG